MILVNFKSGTTLKLDPSKRRDREAIDHPYNQSGITRLSILGTNGHRVDLPSVKNRSTRVWIETVRKNGDIRGECVSLRNGNVVVRVTLYYSDGRVVVDFSE